jgi:hypothetical protein
MDMKNGEIYGRIAVHFDDNFIFIWMGEKNSNEG